MKLIAETAWHHEGDFTFMTDLVSNISNNTHADIIKMHITLNFDEYMDQNHQSYNLLKSMLFSKEQWGELISIIRNSGKELMLLVNDTEAVEFASNYNPEFIELHSVCLNVPHLQNAVLKKFDNKTKIVIGVGGCTLQEVDSAIKFFKNRETILMFGFQNYPTRYDQVNMSKIRKIQKLYINKSFGYADHTGWNEANNELITLLVASNGMEYIEKHVTTHYGQNRCDFSAAISFDMFNSLKNKMNVLKQIYGDGVLQLNEGEKSYSQYGPMKMAALVKSKLKQGHIISLNDIRFQRTNTKTDLSQVDVLNMIGKPLLKSISKNEILKWDHFKETK